MGKEDRFLFVLFQNSLSCNFSIDYNFVVLRIVVLFSYADAVHDLLPMFG